MSPNRQQAPVSDGGEMRRILPGMILIGVGLLALFGSVDLGPWASRLVLAVILAAAAYFAYVTGERNEQRLIKWAALPLGLLAVAALFSGGVGEALVVGVFALAFYLVWQRNKVRWWALIPAGALATIAITQLLEAVLGISLGWVFLIGLAVTFYALTNLEVQPQRWAIYPAVALAFIAVLNIVAASGWVGPVLLIGAGLLLLYRSGALAGLSSFGAPRVKAAPQAEPAQPEAPHEHSPTRPTAATDASGTGASDLGGGPDAESEQGA